MTLMARKLTNECVWFIGLDDGSTGYEVVLEQRDLDSDPSEPYREHHLLFKIEPGGDATAIGMMIGSLDWQLASGSHWRHTETDPRPA